MREGISIQMHSKAGVEGDEALIHIDKQSRIPIYEQLVEALQQEILNGFLVPGELIPSVRSLSMELSVNPNTIQKAYNELERLQITYSVPGVGRYISNQAVELVKKEKAGAKLALSQAIKDLKASGMSLAELLETVEQYYGGGAND